MAVEADQCRKQIDDLLSLPQQSWLLGAGISRDAGIPLMFPLTDHVCEILDAGARRDFLAIRSELAEGSHVEHVLSHIGDLIALATRTKSQESSIGGEQRGLEKLRSLHAEVQKAIRDTMRWGYKPAEGAAPATCGSRDTPIIKVDGHLKFVRALFQVRRANLDRRPPVALFTTNYDTLMEDALALGRVHASDGFVGGAMAFWEPGPKGGGYDRPFSVDDSCQARIYKLHGSIDWFMSEEDLVVRRREGAGYPPEDPARLLIYPQATKYRMTQKDPFARIFAAFRSALASDDAGLLAICGYSFGDDHVNEEIYSALKRRGGKLTVLAFVNQPRDDQLPADEGLPSRLVEWLRTDEPWRERLVVAGRRGVYHGSLDNRCPAREDVPHSWWSFDGVSSLLNDGP